MNTEPPQGDDLQQMLVTMKQNVLARAEADRPAPRRRGRRAGIVIGVIAVLGIGATSGGVALGMIPQPFAAAPAPTSTPSPTGPEVTPTESSAPVVERPTATPTPTSTRKPYALDDPSTWTFSGDEVGPIALGGDSAAELDDVPPTYTTDPADMCPDPGVTFFFSTDAPSMIVLSRDGKVVGVELASSVDPGQQIIPTGPTTVEGAGIGTTIARLQELYPDLRNSRATEDGAFSLWSIERNGHFVTFQLDVTGAVVSSVWSGVAEEPPYEYCA